MDRSVWTGLSETGELVADELCEGWQSGSGDRHGHSGHLDETTALWNHVQRLSCFEQAS